MEPSRRSAVAALVFALVAVPALAVAAVAARQDDGDLRGASSSQRDDRGLGHAKGQKKDEDKQKGSARADGSSAARDHAEAMNEWARCVSEAASEPKSGERTGPPKEKCGDKPVGPGRAKHDAGGFLDSGQPDQPPGQMKQKHK